MDIQPVILDYLSRRKSIDLPGLGRLFWLVKGPSKGNTYSQIVSPSIILQFESAADTSDELSEHLASTYNLAPRQASAVVADWMKHIKSALQSEGRFEMKLLGTLISKNNAVVFEPNTGLIGENLKLPDFIVSPVDRPYSGLSPVNRPEGNDENGTFFRILTNFIIPIILLFLIGLLSFFIYRQLTDPIPGHQNGTMIVTDTTDAEGIGQEDSSLDSHLAPMDSNEQVLTDDTTWQEEEIPIGEEEERLSDFVNRFCIIIVGSFKRQSNVQRMIEKIEAMGLTTHTEQFGEFTRVGVKFDCYENDLYRTLFQLRGKFSDDAWILKYK